MLPCVVSGSVTTQFGTFPGTEYCVCGGSPTMELGLSHGVFGGLLGHGGLGGVVRALCGTTPSSHRPGDEMR